MSQVSDYLDSQGARADRLCAIEREVFDLLEAMTDAAVARIAALEAAVAALTPPARGA